MPRTLFVPASIAKLVSVATAAEKRSAGTIDSRPPSSPQVPSHRGRLFGDLLIVPALAIPLLAAGAAVTFHAFVAAVKAASFGRIEGRSSATMTRWKSRAPQLSWAWDDLGLYDLVKSWRARPGRNECCDGRFQDPQQAPARW